MKRSKQTVKAMAAVILAVLGTALPGRAASDTWATNAVSGAWEDPANWAGGNVPGSTTDTATPDGAAFSAASAVTAIVVDAGRTISDVTITNAKTGAYTIGATDGNTLRLSSGGRIWLAGPVTNSQAILAPVELQGDGGTCMFTNNGGPGRKLNFSGAITGVATGTNVTELVLAGTNGSAGLILSAIGDGANGGRVALRKTGSGGWQLWGASTYSGGTIIESGGLTLGTNGGSLSVFGSGPVTINGGTLYPSGPNGVNTTIAGNLSYTWTTNVTVMGQGNHTLILGTNVVQMDADVSVNMENYTSLNIGGPIRGSGRMLSLRGGVASSFLYLNGSNRIDQGVNLYSGTLSMGNSYALGTNTLSVYGGGMQQTASPLKGLVGMIWYSNVNFSAGVDLGTIPITLVGARRIPSADNGTITIGGSISGTNASLTVQGTQWSGTLRLLGSNTFDGGLTFANGSNASYTVCIDHPEALGAGPFTINPWAGGLPAGTARIDNDTTSAVVVATVNTQYWNRSFTFVGTRSLNMGLGPVVLGTNNLTVTAGGANVLTIGGSIGDGGSGYPLTKAGSGTLVLGGANTYTGLTTVTTGKLSVAVGGSLAGPVRVMPGGVLDLQTGSGLADTATLQVDSTVVGSNTVYGVINVTNGVVEVVRALVVGGTTNDLGGTYGSTNSTARHKITGYFSGGGMVQVSAPGGMVFQVR